MLSLLDLVRGISIRDLVPGPRIGTDATVIMVAV